MLVSVLHASLGSSELALAIPTHSGQAVDVETRKCRVHAPDLTQRFAVRIGQEYLFLSAGRYIPAYRLPLVHGGSIRRDWQGNHRTESMPIKFPGYLQETFTVYHHDSMVYQYMADVTGTCMLLSLQWKESDLWGKKLFSAYAI